VRDAPFSQTDGKHLQLMHVGLRLEVLLLCVCLCVWWWWSRGGVGPGVSVLQSRTLPFKPLIRVIIQYVASRMCYIRRSPVCHLPHPPAPRLPFRAVGEPRQKWRTERLCCAAAACWL
jgi:hypothetical protein